MSLMLPGKVSGPPPRGRPGVLFPRRGTRDPGTGAQVDFDECLF
jgi:hypothetical protein